MEKKVGIIGYGRIGKEVRKKILEKGWETPVVLKSSGIYEIEGPVPVHVQRKVAELDSWQESFKERNIDTAVVSIPTIDDGWEAFEYIRTLVRILGISVATVEKGSLSGYFPDLESSIAKGLIGYSATVSGGTRMLHWLRERVNSETREIHLVVNATINYILDGSSRGRTLDEVINETKILGYAEPGEQNGLEVINIETCRDIPMKTAIVVNTCGFGRIQGKEIQAQPLTENNFKRLNREVATRRYIVSFLREEDNDEDIFGGFKFGLDQWWVSGGFKNLAKNPLFFQFSPPGVSNSALVYGTNGTYVLTGPGAGAAPTASSVIKDIETLKNF